MKKAPKHGRANRAYISYKGQGKDNESIAICSAFSLKFCRILQDITDPKHKKELLSNAKGLAV